MNTDNNLNMNKNNKIELALASLMFFAPLIKYNIKSREDINESDKNFILGFIRLGYINIALLLLAIITQIMYYMTNISILSMCGTIIIIILAVLLLIGSIFVLTEKTIITINKADEGLNNLRSNNISNIILAYIPLYNIYSWYAQHDFDGEKTYAKESLILWGVFSLLLLITSNKYVLIGFGIIILFTMLLDIFQVHLGSSYNQFINNLFKKNPEEIWGSLIGTCIAPFGGKSVKESIDAQKSKYSLIFKLDYKQVLLELIILILLCGFGIYMGVISTNYAVIIGIILILARYLIMLVKWKHMPHIPGIKEITNIFFISKNI